MLSITNLLCDYQTGNERLRYGHRTESFPPRPVVVWNITKACNLRCIHCYASAQPHAAPGELTLQEALALLDDLHEFQIPAILFSGGEPLARPDVLKLIAHARSLGLHCTLSTNGLLIDEAMADKLAILGMQYVGISLDGLKPRHDKLRGMKGAFEGSLAAIDRCRDAGLKVGVRYTVHALNHQDLEAIFDLCREHDAQRLCVYHLAYAGRGGKMQKVDLTAAQTRDIVDRIMVKTQQFHAAGFPLEVLTVGNHADAGYLLLKLEAQDSPHLHAIADLLRHSAGNRSGSNVACIDPLGNVHYDQFSWHYNCGNVRNAPFSQIWSEAADVRLAILRDRFDYLPERCRSCRFVDCCNGNLRTRAEVATGNWLGMDPSCYLTDAEIAGSAA